MGEQKIDVVENSEAELNQETNEYYNRRARSDKERDRRVINRISIPEMRPNLNLIRQLAYVGSIATVAWVVAINVRHFLPEANFDGYAKTVFVSTVGLILAYHFFRVSESVKAYLENESQQRLTSMVERTSRFMFASVVIGAILGAVHILTLIH